MSLTWTPLGQEPDLLGESPFWHPLERTLYWSDIPGRRLRRYHAPSGRIDTWTMPSEAGCIAPALKGGLVLALRDGIYRAMQWGGPLAKLLDAPHDTQTTRFNDGKCDALGRFWPGSMYEPRDKNTAALYCVDARSGRTPALQTMLGGVAIANGLDWSPDASTLYWADTVGHVVTAWDWDAQANRLGASRVLRRFPDKPAGWQPVGDARPYGGRPDGAAVDSEGNYWVAMFEGQRLLKLSPSGDELASIEVPARCPTMPCFGGDDLRTLYVTTARSNRPAEELAAQPHAGYVFSTRVDVPGRPVNFFSE